MRKISAVLVLLMTLAGSCAYGANIDKQIKTQQKNQADMKKKISQYNAIAKQKSKQSKTLLSQLSRLKQNANDSEEQISTLEKENNRLKASSNQLTTKINSLSASMAITLGQLRGRLLDIYKYTQDESTISIILSAREPHDAVNTAYMLRRFVHRDVYVLEELGRKERELTEARNQLEANRKKLAQQTNELKKKRDEFDSTIQKTDTLLKNVQKEQKKAESAAKELQAAQRAVGNKINALMKQKKNARARTSTRTTTAKVTTVQGSKAAVPVKTTAPVPAGGVKSLSWPVNGVVTMQYGSRVHPTFKTKIFNSGIDIKAASGTAVKAAGPGEVLYQGWLRGFGQVVIIDHGGDLSTVYAHLGGASVREGASVKAGTVIGKVGNTGTDSAYGLHFEVRRGGSAVNPMNYLR